MRLRPSERRTSKLGKMYKCIFLLTLLAVGAFSLFSGEQYIYNNETKSMTQWVVVELRKEATVPLTLNLNSLCTVPDFQLTGKEYLSTTNGTKRSSVDPALECLFKNNFNQLACLAVLPIGIKIEDCEGIGYCRAADKSDSLALLRDKGSCEGAKGVWTHMMDEECLNIKKDRILNDIKTYSEEARRESYKLVENTVWETFNKTGDEINNFLSDLNSTVVNLIGQVQAEVVAATTQYSAMFTKSMNTAFGSLVQQGQTALRDLSQQNTKRMETLGANLRGLGTFVTINSRMMYSALLRTSVNDHQSQNRLKTYLSSVVDKANLVQLSLQTYTERLNLAVLNLLIRANNLNLMESQGEDISTLLTQWFNINNGTNVLQDLTRESTYTYAVNAYIGKYGSDGVMADPQDEVVGKAVYECYEEGEEIDYGNDTIGEVLVSTNYVDSNGIRYKVSVGPAYDPGRGGWSNTFYQRLLDATALPYSKMEVYRNGRSEAYTYYNNGQYTFGTATSECKNTPHMHIKLYNSTGNVYFEYQYVDREQYSCDSFYTTSLCPGVSNVGCYGDWATANITANFGTSPVGLKLQKRDKGDPIYIVDEVMSVLSLVVPDQVNVSVAGVKTWDNDIVITDNYLVSSYKGAIFRNVVPGTGGFYLQHPTRGSLKIHRCSRVTSPVVAQSGTPLAELDGSYLIRSGGNLYPGRKTVSVLGLEMSSYVQLLVPQGTDNHDLRPDVYAYSKDKWCCGADGNPRVANSDCSSIRLGDCKSAIFANCTVTGVRTLTMIRGGVCPGGVVPSTTEVRYLSPNVYYCSKAGKNTKPLEYGLEYCETKNMRMPGAGVEIETGVMSPQGYYPAKCIYWSEAQGRADLHSIYVNVSDKTLPTMIANLRDSKVVFKVTADTVVDEMNDIMGIGNGGYDCVTYEVDKILHRPKNCRNYALPLYNTTSYFAGRVRSSGLSRMLDFFDISMISNSESKVLLNFTLKQGIDYQSAYFPTNNLCPRLQVDYTTGTPKYCKVSGWSTTEGNVDVQVNSLSVCRDGVCDTEKSILDGRNVSIDIMVEGKRTNCYKFVCMAATQSFVAYPGETFEGLANRFKKVEAISRISGYDYQGVIDSLLSQLIEKISNASSQIITGGLGTTVEVNLTLPMVTPEYKSIALSVARVADQGKSAISNITSEQQQLLVNITRSGLESMIARGREMFDNHTRSQAAIIEEMKKKLQVTVTVEQSSLFDWVGRLQDAYGNSLQSIVISIVSLVMAMATCGACGYVMLKC